MHDVVHLAQRMIERQRLDVEHVEPGAGDLLVAQGREHRRLVDDRTARRVDQVGGGLHQAEFLGPDDAARSLRQDNVDGDEVRLAEQIVLADIADAGCLAFLRRQVLAPGDDLHAERLGDVGGSRAELAEAEDAKRHAVEIGADGGLPGGAGVQPRILVTDVPRQFEHEADGDAGGRAAERARAADHDAARLRRLGIDRGIAHAGGDQELEVGQGLDHLLGEAGPLAHGDDDVEALERRDHFVGSAEMFIEDFNVHVAFDRRPVGDLEDDILIIVENCAANRHNSSTPRHAFPPQRPLAVS